jgi:uncharacterized protein
VIDRLVVSDTSPLRALSHLRLLGALGTLFVDVVIPPAVLAEVGVNRPKMPALDLAPYSFIRVASVTDPTVTARFAVDLDPGESEAIALALELKAVHLLIDEREGRNMAVAVGLIPMGVIGLLIELKKAGSIPLVRPLVERLRGEIDFRVSTNVLHAALALAGE